VIEEESTGVGALSDLCKRGYPAPDALASFRKPRPMAEMVRLRRSA